MPFKKNIFTLLSLLSAIQLFFASCGITETIATTYDVNATINSPTSTAFVKNLLFIIKPYINENGHYKYVVSDSVVNVKVQINNYEWGSYRSSALDTSLVSKTTLNSYLVSTDTIKYTVVADNRIVKDTLTTAGSYARMLHNYLMLEAGDYIFQITSFDVKLKNGKLRKVYPGVTQLLHISDKMISLFVGEYNVEVK